MTRWRSMFEKMDEILDVCLEEIALEGLDGITLNAFWMRLENREPKFSLKVDLFAKKAIWERLSTSADVEFYKLPAPRDLPVLPTEIRNQDPVTGIIVVKTQKEKNVYPAHSISSEKHGVFGSCSTFTTRKNITSDVRDERNTSKVMFEEVVKSFGDKLVMVASQKLRMKALLGAETCRFKELQDVSYMVLEWIGRARHYGVFQSDALKELQIDHKTAFYYRNWLSRNGYVTSQQVLKQENEKSFVRVNLVFLKRKTVQQPYSRYDLMSEDVSKYLEQTPHRIASMDDIKSHMMKLHKHVDCDMFRRNIGLMKSMGYIEKHMIPHQLVTGYTRRLVQRPDQELKVGCVRLLKVFRIESEEEEPEQVNYDIRDSMLYKGRGGVDQLLDFISRSYLEDGKALTQSEIIQSLKLSKLYVRSLLRRLESQKAITSNLIDTGRQKTSGFLPVNHPRDVSKSAPLIPKSGSPGRSAADQSEEMIANETEEDKPPAAKVSINFSQARMEKRKRIILGITEKRKAIIGTGAILKEIRESEVAEGLKAKVDGKTIKRLLKKMYNESEIKEFCVDVGSEHGHTCKITIYASKEITLEDPKVQSLISQEEFHRTGRNNKEPRAIQKLKLVEKAKKEEAEVEKNETEIEQKTENISEEDSSKVETQQADEEYGEPMQLSFDGGRSRILPKMPKLQLVHEFLWYSVYGNSGQGRPEENRKRTKDSFKRFSSPKVPRRNSEEETDDGVTVNCENTENKIDEKEEKKQELQEWEEQDEDEEDSKKDQRSSVQEKVSKHLGEKKTPIVYKEVEDWRRFVAPLPWSKDRVEGWFVLGDVVQRMPVSVFVQLTGQEYLLENISEYLDDAVKMHYPVNKLPKKMRQKIHQTRSFIDKIEKCLLGLTRLGLLWLGPQRSKIKEERSFFLCKKAKLKDTTSSDIHYKYISDKPYPERWYDFNTFADVNKYWYDFMLYSLNTPLGVCIGPRGVSRRQQKRPEETLGYLAQRWDTMLTKPDQEGNIKGDGKGACGMDSSNFTHLKRNWSVAKVVPLYRSQMTSGKYHKQPLESEEVKRLKGLEGCKTDSSLTRVSIRAGKLIQVPVAMKQVSSEECKKSTKGGKGLKRKKDEEKKPTKALKRSHDDLKKMKATYDEKDRLTRQRSKRQRCIWTPKEDNFILMCCITSAILDKKVKRLFVPWREICNILHERFETSRDKLATSVSKRATYIFNYPQTKINYSICLTEICEDEELMSDFMSRQEDYTKPEVCAKEYRELLDVIIEKYKTKTSVDELAVTSLSFKDLLEKYDIVSANVEKDPRRYKIVKKEDVKSQEDVQRAVIQSLILGALHSQRQADYRPSDMFDVFRQYDDAQLKHSFTFLRDVSVISRHRNAYDLSVGQLNRVMPHVPMSYQLSSVYYRFFTSRISDIISDVSQFWTSIETSEDGLVDISLDPTGGCCAGALQFTALDLGKFEVTLPDQLIIVNLEASNEKGIPSSEREVRTLDQDSDNDDEDDRGQDEDEEEMENEDAELLKLFSETQEGWPSSARVLLQGDSKEQKGDKVHAPKLSVIPESSEEAETSELQSREDVNTISFALPSTSCQSEVIEKVGMGQNNESERDKDVTSMENSGGLRLPSLSVRHNLLILRDLVRPKVIVGRYGHLPEEVVINSCNLTLKIDDEKLKEHMGTWEGSCKQHTLVEFLSGSNETFVPFLENIPLSKCLCDVDRWFPVVTIDRKNDTWATFTQRFQSSKFHTRLDDLEKVYSFIKQGKFKGATIPELEEAFPNWSEFIRNVNILIKEKMVLEVGVTQLRLVTTEHISDWVVKCPRLHQKQSGSHQDTCDSEKAITMDESNQAKNEKEKDGQDTTEDNQSTLGIDESCTSETTATEDIEDQSKLVTGGGSLELKSTRGTTEDAVTQQSGHVASIVSARNLSLFEAIQTEEERKGMSFDLLGRTFYKIAATVNRKQVQELLTRVAGFVVENPGYKEEEITKAVEPVVHPVECLLILQKLTEFGCISRHKCQQKRYKGPFAMEGHGKHIVFYMPSADCICRLSLLVKSCQ